MERELVDMLSSHTSLALAATDADGTLTLLSPALERMLGRAYVRVTEADMPGELRLFNEDGTVPLRPEDLPTARARQGETVHDAVVTVRREPGEPGEPGRPGESDEPGRPGDGPLGPPDAEPLVYLRCNGVPLTGPDGRNEGAVLLVQDITEERLAAQRQAVLRQRLVETVNHELRTPLTRILGHVEVLSGLEDALPAWGRSSIEAINRAADELRDLAMTITHLADLEAATRVTPSYGNVVHRVAEVVDSLAAQASAAGVRVVLDAPERVPATVDMRLLKRAVRELVVNALTFAPAGSVVRVAVRADDRILAVSVCDSGPGVPAEDRVRLLEPFERGSAPQQPVSSRGLGLALAQTIAGAHGGEVVLAAVEPSGLAATVRINRYC